MSLLLDALKEAEARKREGSPAPAAGSRLETVGALALAEDRLPEPELAPAVVPAAQRAAPSPVEQLLAARLARATPAVAAGARAAAAVVPPAPATAARPTAIPRGIPALQTRRALPWLLGIAALLALLIGAAILYDGGATRTPLPSAVPAAATPPAIALAAPTTPPPALPAALNDAPGMQSRNRPASALPTPPLRDEDGAMVAAGTQPDTPRASTPRDTRISIAREAAPLDSAWAAHQAGDTERARALYLRVLSAEPGQVDAQLGLAVLAHARGDDEVARRGYRQVLESVPDHPRAWAGLAELAGADEAGPIESRLHELLANRPSAPLHFALGNVLARQERWADAQQAYFAAATLAPEAADYAYNVAVALERLGKPAAALPWYRRALDQATAGRAVRFDAAVVQARLEQLQAAPP